MVTMAGLQVFIVRFFFQGARKGKFIRIQWDERCIRDIVANGFAGYV